MEKIRLEENIIKELVTKFLLNKPNGNWHEDRTKTADLHGHGVDIKFCGGKRNSEFFLIECKGKSYAKSARSINRQNSWVYALGQIIKRMDTKRIISSGAHKGEVNHAYKYGLALCDESARVALYSIPYEIARVQIFISSQLTNMAKSSNSHLASLEKNTNFKSSSSIH